MATKYVSQSTGSDANNGSTALLAKLTLGGAKAIIASGDTVQVLDGTFNEHAFLQKNIAAQTWNFALGTVVDYTGGGPLFTDAAGAGNWVKATITGRGIFYCTDSQVFYFENASSVIRGTSKLAKVKAGGGQGEVCHCNGVAATLDWVSEEGFDSDTYDSIVNSNGFVRVQSPTFGHFVDESSLEGSSGTTILVARDWGYPDAGVFDATVDVTAQRFIGDISIDTQCTVYLRDGTFAAGSALQGDATFYLVNCDARLATITAGTVIAMGNTQMPSGTTYINLTNGKNPSLRPLRGAPTTGL